MKKRITIIGAGAVGLELAIRIAASNAADVTIVGKEGSERLRAVQEREVFVRAHHTDPIGDVSVSPGKIRAVSDVRAITELQHYACVVIMGQHLTKEFSTTTLHPLIEKNPEIAIVMVQNGVPVWMNHTVEALEDFTFPSIDSDGEILHSIGADRIIGMVLNRVTNYMDRPGEVINATPPPEDQPRIIIGRPDGKLSRDLNVLAAILNRAAMSTDVTDKIREPLFNKLMLNIGGCVTAITGQSLDVTFGDNDYATQVGTAAITEARRVIRQYYNIDLPEAGYFIGIMASLTGYEPSILKALKDGKETERKPMLDTVSDMAQWTYGRTTPVIEALSSAIEEFEQIATREGDISMKKQEFDRKWNADPSPVKTIIRASENPDMSMDLYVPSSTVEVMANSNSIQTINDGVGAAHMYFLNIYLLSQGVDPSSMYEQPGTWANSVSRQSISPPIEGKKWAGGIVKRTAPIPIPSSSHKRNSADHTDDRLLATSYESTSSEGSQEPESCNIQEGWKSHHPVTVTKEKGMIYFWFANNTGRENIGEIRNLRYAIVDSINEYLIEHKREEITAHQHTNYIAFDQGCESTLKSWYKTQFSETLTISSGSQQSQSISRR